MLQKNRKVIVAYCVKKHFFAVPNRKGFSNKWRAFIWFLEIPNIRDACIGVQIYRKFQKKKLIFLLTVLRIVRVLRVIQQNK